MPGVIAAVIDAADAMVRRLFGHRLCDYCHQWAKNPHQSGGLYFCDRIHASIHFGKQAEAMKQALKKKSAAPESSN
jgi:hypothetical protein